VSEFLLAPAKGGSLVNPHAVVHGGLPADVGGALHLSPVPIGTPPWAGSEAGARASSDT
jgi:hypothetical protein